MAITVAFIETITVIRITTAATINPMVTAIKLMILPDVLLLSDKVSLLMMSSELLEK